MLDEMSTFRELGLKEWKQPAVVIGMEATTTTEVTEDAVWAIHRANQAGNLATARDNIRARLLANVPTAEDVFAAMQAAR